MKTFLIAGILGLAGAAGAEAQDMHTYRKDGPRHESKIEVRHFGQRGHYRRHEAPKVERVWVPARYESRFAGYDHCGKPIYQSVLVCEGHWTTRPICD